MLRAQVRWLRAKRASQQLVMVLHAGDVVNKVHDTRQWNVAARYLGYLARKVPIVVAAGNHDLLDHKQRSRSFGDKPRHFNRLVRRIKGNTIAGTYKPGDYRNTYSFFSARGVRAMVLNLEFGASRGVLAWAGRVADKYPSRHVMLLTHDYLSQRNRLRGRKGDALLPSGFDPQRSNGRGIWRRLVNRHPNIQFVFSGHVTPPLRSPRQWAAGRLITTNALGRPVYQSLSNYQNLNFGDGYLRLYRFFPGAKRVEVRTYSPYRKRFLADRRNQFKYTRVHLWDWSGADAPATEAGPTGSTEVPAASPVRTPLEILGPAAVHVSHAEVIDEGNNKLAVPTVADSGFRHGR